MANSTLTGLLIIVLLVDAICFLGQVALADTGLTNSTNLGVDAGVLEKLNGGSYSLNSTDPNAYLPGSNPGISTNGNIISDTYNDLKIWFSKASSTVNAGFDILLSLLAGPYPYFVSIGLPQSVNFVVGAVWYLLTIMLIVAFVAGRTWM